jgi:hypothetical protein
MLGKPDVKTIQTEGLGEFGLNQFGEFHACDSLNQLAHEPTVGESVVPVGLARNMARTRPLKHTNHSVPIEHLPGILDHIANSIKPCFVAEHLSNRNFRFVSLAKLRPVVGNRNVVVGQPTVHEDVEKG